MHVPRPIAAKLARNAALLWVGVHVLELAILWLAESALGRTFGPIAPLPFGLVVFPALVLVLVWVDVRATGERVLLGNLGIRPRAISTVVLLVAASLELAVGLILNVMPQPSLGPTA